MKSILTNIISTATGKLTGNGLMPDTLGWFVFALLILHAGGNLSIDWHRADAALDAQPDMVAFQVPEQKPPAPPAEKKPETRHPVMARDKAENRFHPIIIRAASRYNVDAALIKAVIKAESGYNARAVSKRGAMGLMQLMPGTAEELGVVDGFNPEHNINGGVRYLKRLMDRFDGNISLALAAYNAGSRKVRHYNGIPPFKATHIYIKKVFRYYRIYSDQMLKDVDNA